MKLYHGTNIDFDSIDLNKCKPHKDFGQGFYLTDIKEQAKNMAIRDVTLFRKVLLSSRNMNLMRICWQVKN
ncbi:DUF3990 domain-containing protein [Segatella albensis]|uniref:DUF3990 domain-containing protein n=1 Tax=Segatella albensis TaxID=77768 RepID=UPI000A4A9E57|nr:DUF3990 domain-containing protein [Segatella albensis]